MKTSSFSFKKFIGGIPKIVKILTVAVVVLAIAVTTFFIIGSSSSDPSKIAKGYFEALTKGDYNKAFEYLSLDETEFVSKAGFSKYMENKGDDYKDVVNFTVSESRSVLSGWGITTSNENNNGFTKVYTVKYAVKGGSSNKTMTITLVKNSEKKMLFFDDYDVSIDDLLVSDYTVSVPKGATASIDGVALSEKSSDSESNSKSLDTYKVSKIFAGEHELVVTSEFCEEYKNDITASAYGNSTTVSGLTMKESLRKELAQKTNDVYGAMFKGAIAGKSFDSLGLAITSDSTKATAIKSAYENFFKSIKINENGVGYKSVTFKSYTDSSYQTRLDDDMDYSCSIRVKYDAVKVEKSWWEDKLEDKSITDDERSVRFDFVYEKDKWVIQSVSIGSYY